MAVEKLSISVPPEVSNLIKVAAAAAGISVSAWLADAALHKSAAAQAQAAGRAAARQLVAEYESEHGPLPTEARRRARQALRQAGLLDGVPDLHGGPDLESSGSDDASGLKAG